MMNKSHSASPVMEIPLGTTVYDVEGEKVGKVTFSALHTGYFMVERGWLMTYEIYLPLTAIMMRDMSWVKLRLSKEELRQSQWKHPPSGHLSEAATPTPAAADSAVAGAGPAEGRVIHLPPSREEEPPLANR